eukprot:TRINITY_DN27863_c0_g1_i1.p1 TRINITY_DN27863_c0_g1~~TRINITY_DN27863_c0_g1_i1.p1  ORF type:complete len:286 (+),score=73.08 TRINITY_DN27863_c0_g1_i1:38-859(+)
MASITYAVVVACTVLSGPPREMPEDLVQSYTLEGKIPVADMFVDDTGPEGKGTHYKYAKENVQGFVDAAERMKRKGVNLKVDNKRMWIFSALEKYPLLKDSRVGVYGSMEPWFEAVALVHGAKEAITIEYNKITYDYDGITTVTVEECRDGSEHCTNLDAAFSMSSFDHDGLGRYGDPLNPDGDIKAMEETLSQLKPNGVLYLTVPIGPDVVVWNLHRRYGEIRLPMLLKGWEVVDRIGWDEAKLTAEASWRQTYEPILVLRKPAGKTTPDEL